MEGEEERKEEEVYQDTEEEKGACTLNPKPQTLPSRRLSTMASNMSVATATRSASPTSLTVFVLLLGVSRQGLDEYR